MPTNFIKSYKAEVGLNHVPAYQAHGHLGRLMQRPDMFD